MKWGRRIFVPTKPDLADILGRTDLDFESFHVIDFLDPKFLDFQVPRFPKSGLGRAGLGPWAGLGPSGGPGLGLGPGGPLGWALGWALRKQKYKFHSQAYVH